jgi:processive 1,2-diacylglycerol beta-glucosyltransferase/1,2-diacylglycerol 3-beta-galactosyltransferase
MFFYLKTGGGHLAPAKAVAEKIKSKNKKSVEIILADGLSESPPLLRKIIEDGYRNAVNKAVWTFEFLYAIHKIKMIAVLTSVIVSKLIKPKIEKQILAGQADKIVLFHFFLVKPVFEIIREHNLNIPVLTVVTDPFTAHPIWFIQKDQNYIVFSEILREQILKKNINEKSIRVFPFVLDKKYSKRLNASKIIAIRSELGFRIDSKIILIMGGGEGMPKGKRILKNILKYNIDAEIAVVCGRNKNMQDHMTNLKIRHQLTNVRIFGYIDFVHKLISISDVVISKCGASTFMEILLLGKVQIINNYIWEQEKGNMEFVCNGEMGILEKNAEKIPSVINRLFTDEEYYNNHIRNIRKASIRNGVEIVSDYIIEFNT